MLRRAHIAVAFAVGMVAICVPILASIYFAWYQSLNAQKSLGLTYAHDIMRRAEKTANQFAYGKARLVQSKFPPCSPQEVDLFRQIALSSSYIQAAGRVSGETLICSSLGAASTVPLGKPNLVSARGVQEYFNVKLFPQQWTPVDVFVSDGFAIVVDPELPLDIPTEGPDVKIALFASSAPKSGPIASLGGRFDPNWFQGGAPGSESSFLDRGYLVSRVHSANWDLSAATAIPEHYIFERVRHFALIFAPIGLLCGILLGAVADYIALHRSSFPTMVRRAVRNKEFYVEYQPIVELGSRRIVGAEALVRWKTPLATIPPDHFIPLAEERGLMHLITRQVLASVASDLPRILALDPAFEVAINMSSSDLKSGRTLEYLDRLLDAAGAQPRNIGIEATERAFLYDRETTELIGALRLMGFRVAIDDFGTGYSSLACLQSLSLDTLKIDKAFVDTIDTDGVTSQVIHHIIEMAHSLGLELVAEGVQTEPQAQFLYHRGVRYAQGWLFGKPLPIAGLLDQIERRSSVSAFTSV